MAAFMASLTTHNRLFTVFCAQRRESPVLGYFKTQVSGLDATNTIGRI